VTARPGRSILSSMETQPQELPTPDGSLATLVRRVLVGQTSDSRIQFLRYLVVGGVATVGDFSTLFVFTHWVHVHYLVSNILGFCVGLIINYVLSLVWVFSTRKLSSRVAEFTLFAVVGVIGVGLSELIMWLLTGLAGAHYMVSKVVATMVVLVWNFSARKFLMF
jgi:putative flippase GtrA